MTHKHLEDVDPSTLSPEELRERLSWDRPSGSGLNRTSHIRSSKKFSIAPSLMLQVAG